MTAWLITWFVVSLVVGGALLSVASGLVRRLKVLGRTLRRFSDDVQPLTEAIAREGARASERGSTLGERSRSSPR